jgi:hypothetical protein
MCRMNPNGSMRGNRDRPNLLMLHLKYKSGGLRQPNEPRFAPLFDRHNRAVRFQDDILGGGTKHQFANF